LGSGHAVECFLGCQCRSGGSGSLTSGRGSSALGRTRSEALAPIADLHVGPSGWQAVCSDPGLCFGPDRARPKPQNRSNSRCTPSRALPLPRCAKGVRSDSPFLWRTRFESVWIRLRPNSPTSLLSRECCEGGEISLGWRPLRSATVTQKSQDWRYT
jgi:hypothetical protein